MDLSVTGDSDSDYSVIVLLCYGGYKRNGHISYYDNLTIGSYITGAFTKVNCQVRAMT